MNGAYVATISGKGRMERTGCTSFTFAARRSRKCRIRPEWRDQKEILFPSGDHLGEVLRLGD